MSFPNQPSGGGGPSWDEFNMAHEEEDPPTDGGGATDSSDSNDEQDQINEPGQPEEFGPSLPPGFGGDDSQGEQQPAGNDLLNGFSIPIENYDLDDPEDPLQCSSSSSSNIQRRAVGPQVPSSLLPNTRSDEHLLPSFGNVIPSPAVDFIPSDHPGGPISNHGPALVIGPTLPPDLNPTSNSNNPTSNSSTIQNEQPRAFPNMDGLDDIGPAMPPDEPQCSVSSRTTNSIRIEPPSANQQTSSRHCQERHIGPTLPTSEDEEEDDGEEGGEEDQDEEEGRRNGEVLAMVNDQEEEEEGGEGEQVEEEEHMIGPMPPAPGRSEEEEETEYLQRLAEFEANKKSKASNGLKREEWMTELPQKMLKAGAFGLSAKTSFSRSSAAGPSTSAADTSAWTSVPNANGKKNGNGPSTSAAPKPPPPKRSEQDELEEQRANALNKQRNNESLMDIHRKKRKLDAPSSSLIKTNSGERRPFNRDTDMEVRGLGNSDPAALKERMGELSNRFGHSSEKKFL